MKKRTFALFLALTMAFGLLCACGGETAASEPAPASEPSEAAAPVEEVAVEEPQEPSVAEEPQEPSLVEEPAEESVVEEPVEEPAEEPAGPVTITFSDGQTFEANVGEDFVFFFQCDAPGDMGEPAEGEEGAGITVSEGTVTYSNVGLGGPYSYPTSEKVTISGFTGDITVTICDEATNMGATYTIYTDEQEIADAIAFAEEMAKQQAANPMP